MSLSLLPLSVNLNLSGLGGIALALLALALASEHFGDMLMYMICLISGVVGLAIVFITKVALLVREWEKV